MPPDPHALVSPSQVREIIGASSPAVEQKVFDRLGPTERRFLAHAPFALLKAFRRSRLWRAETWPEPLRISFGALLAPKLGGDETLAARIDEAIEDDYRSNL